MMRTPPDITIRPDAEYTNADWVKQTWDLGIDNAEDLRAWLKAGGSSVAEFKRSPLYRMHADKLSWLKDL